MPSAKEIWKSRPDCIKIGMSKFGLSYDDAHDIFVKTAQHCLENNDYDPNRGTTLDYFVKMKMQSFIKNYLRRESRFNEIIDDQHLYNHHERYSDYIQSPLSRARKIELVNNGLKIVQNERDIIHITTKSENSVKLGDSIFLSGLTDLSENTKNRLKNKNGDELHVNKIIDKKTFTIRVNFEHDIADSGSGGENAFVKFVRKNSYLRAENPKFFLTGEKEENEQLIDIQKERCLKKLKQRDRTILEYNLFPEHDNEKKFLGFKDPETEVPKYRNDGSPLQHGDKYYIQDKNNQSVIDENWRIYLNGSWVSAEQEEIKIKPMTTERIAEKLNMASGTVGELLSKAKKQFALCMQEAGYA